MNLTPGLTAGIVQISAGTLAVLDAISNQLVVVVTESTATVTSATLNSYIVCKYEYKAEQGWYADFSAVSAADAYLPGTVILGRVTAVDGGGFITAFDVDPNTNKYLSRQYGDRDKLNEIYNNLRVVEDIANPMTVQFVDYGGGKAGKLVTSDGRFYIDTGDLGDLMPLADNTSGNPRIDLIVVDNVGTLSILQGTPAVSPVFPNYSGYYPLAAITIPTGSTSGGNTKIYQSQIENLPFYRGTLITSNLNAPDWNTLDTTGMYIVTNGANSPDGNGTYSLTVNSNGTNIVQLAVNISTNLVKMRISSNGGGTWGTWIQSASEYINAPDWNTLINTGVYIVTNGLNSPAGLANYSLTINVYGTVVSQTAVNISTNSIYTRTSTDTGSTWSEWKNNENQSFKNKSTYPYNSKNYIFGIIGVSTSSSGHFHNCFTTDGRYLYIGYFNDAILKRIRYPELINYDSDFTSVAGGTSQIENDGVKIYCPSYNNHLVTAVLIRDFATTTTYTMPNINYRPRRIIIDPKNNFMYVNGGTTVGTIYKVNTSTMTSVATFNLTGQSPDNCNMVIYKNWIFVADGTNIRYISLLDFTTTGTIPGPLASISNMISDGKYLFVVSSSGANPIAYLNLSNFESQLSLCAFSLSSYTTSDSIIETDGENLYLTNGSGSLQSINKIQIYDPSSGKISLSLIKVLTSTVATIRSLKYFDGFLYVGSDAVYTVIIRTE